MNTLEPIEASKQGTELTINRADLDHESLELLNQIIAENDAAKAKDLTHLFNANQNKKTMIRINKLGELMDVIADQTISRFQQRPDEISNQELLQGLKIVQDIVERGQKQIAGTNETPLIQVNTQTNEFNLGDSDGKGAKESRDRVKEAVMSILAGLNKATPEQNVVEADIVETEIKEDNKDAGC